LHFSIYFYTILFSFEANYIMAKVKKAFFCKQCGNESPKWLGKCPGCGEWNSYIEEITSVEPNIKNASPITNWTSKPNTPVLLNEIEWTNTSRHATNDIEFNRVMGGGIVPGSITLIGGEPGIGKSTLLLQIALMLKDLKVLYVSGEESAEQIKMRSDRIDLNHPNLYIFSETNTQAIFQQISKIQPQLLIIDSIQTVYSNLIMSSAGSISQVRECAAEFQRLAKETQIPVILIGHINKDGELAGPKILEHIVDVVLQFEGDRNYTYRLLRTIKNRFGSALELGVYEMKGYGLRPVINPSEILMSQRDEALSGISIAATLEGLRPLMIETQALVASAVYGNPQRSTTGFDNRRLNMLLAVLEKRAGFALGQKDVFLNIAGGIKIMDPAIDLAVISAVMSSFEDVEISSKIAFCGEVGLSGEIRAINRIEQRIAEADKLGFEKIFISKYNQKVDTRNYKIQIVEVGKVLEVFNKLF
jgi:DNA repair protein RadA/Sms